jgi:hypothetical protein
MCCAGYFTHLPSSGARLSWSGSAAIIAIELTRDHEGDKDIHAPAHICHRLLFFTQPASLSDE